MQSTTSGSTESKSTEYLTVSQVATIYKVNPQTIRRWVQQGAPCIRRGRVIRVPEKGLREWLAASAQDGGAPWR
jgi:excisionase family DNA binding protein